MSDRSTLIGRIRKLLALGTSPNEYEAAAALDKARELLQRHHLDIDSIGTAPSGPQVEYQAIGLSIRARTWRRSLAISIGTHVYCKTIHLGDRMHFVGRPENVEAALALYRWVEPQVVRLTATEGGYADFSYGVVIRIGQRLVEMRSTQDASPAATALVVRSGAEIDSFLKMTWKRPFVERQVGPTQYDDAAMGAGIRAGDRVDLRQGALPSTPGALTSGSHGTTTRPAYQRA